MADESGWGEYTDSWAKSTFVLVTTEAGLDKPDRYILGELREINENLQAIHTAQSAERKKSEVDLMKALDGVKSDLESVRKQFTILLVMVGIIGVLVFLGL